MRDLPIDVISGQYDPGPTRYPVTLAWSLYCENLLLLAKVGCFFWQTVGRRTVPSFVTTGILYSAVFSFGLRNCNSVGRIFFNI